MNNFLISLKRFFTNKNTITVLGVLIILLLLYFGYNKAIELQTVPTKVCVATETIQPRTLLTDSLINCTVEVPKKFVSQGNYARVASNVIGKYSAINTVIPKGSVIYNDVLVTEDQLPFSAFYKVPEGQRPYALSVTTASTYGNSIFPGSVVDIFMKATDENGQIMVGRFISNAEVLAVKDSLGNHVFEDTTANRTPATLLFGVPENVYVLLKKAEYLRSYGVELFPVPYGGTSQIPNSIMVDREELVDFIESNTVTFFENEDVNTQIQE